MTDILILTTYAREIRPTMQDFLDRMEYEGRDSNKSRIPDFSNGRIYFPNVTIHFKSSHMNSIRGLRPAYFVSLDPDAIRYFTSRGSTRLIRYDEIFELIYKEGRK